MEDTDLKSESLTIKKTRILRRRNDRMKIQFNLNKEEATAFTNFFNAVNVENNSEEEFTKAAFILGLQAMERSIVERMKEEYEKEMASKESEEPEIVEEDAESTETEE